MYLAYVIYVLSLILTVKFFLDISQGISCNGNDFCFIRWQSYLESFSNPYSSQNTVKRLINSKVKRTDTYLPYLFNIFMIGTCFLFHAILVFFATAFFKWKCCRNFKRLQTNHFAIKSQFFLNYLEIYEYLHRKIRPSENAQRFAI